MPATRYEHVDFVIGRAAAWTSPWTILAHQLVARLIMLIWTASLFRAKQTSP